MPYPRRLLWDILPQNTPNSQNLLLRCPPTDFTDLHRYLGCAVLPQNLAAWVWQGCHTLLICAHPCHLWEALLCQKFLCVPCVLWESLSSHGFLLRRVWDILPRNTPNSQNLLLRCPPTDFTDLHRYLGCAVLPRNSQNSQNLAAWVWQGCHTLLICAHLCHLWEALLCKRFCVFGVFRGSFFTACSVGAAETAAPPGSAAWVWQGCHTLLHLCASVPSVGVLSLQEVLCIRCIPWELLHRLFGWCSRDCCTPWRNPRK